MGFTLKQRNLIMMLLRKKGILRELSEKLAPLSPRSFPPGAVSGSHFKSFERLLKHKVPLEDAVEMTRLGGGFPRHHEFEKQISSRLDDVWFRGKKELALGDIPGLERFSEAEDQYSLALKAHPSMLKSWMGWPVETQKKMARLFDDWYHGRGAGNELRELFNQAIGNLPPTKLVRPDDLKKIVRVRRTVKRFGRVPEPEYTMPGKREFSVELQTAARDVYVNNQAVLQKEYPSKLVKLYRGVGEEQAYKIREAMQKEGRAILDTSTLSSWSDSLDIAADFAGYRGVFVSVDMPIERSVFSHRSIVHPAWRPQKEHIIFGDRFWLTPDEVIEEKGGFHTSAEVKMAWKDVELELKRLEIRRDR